MPLSTDARNRLGIALTDFVIGDQVADAIDATSSASDIANTPAGNITATTVQGAINELDAEKLSKTGAETYSGAKRCSVTVLTSTANSIAVNLALNNDFSHTTTENTTLAAPTNAVVGQKGKIVFTQNAASTLAFDVFWKFPNGILPSLTLSAGAIDILYYDVYAPGSAVCSMAGDVK